MKNAMKKIMSLLLVAVLLVSAVPFQASANEIELVTPLFEEESNQKTRNIEEVGNDEPEYITITTNFYGKDNKGNNVLVADYVEQWEKGVKIQKLWNELYPSELEGQSWTANYPGDESITSSCTVNFYTGKVVSIYDDSDDGVDLITPSDNHTPTFTLIHMVNGKENWSDKVEAGDMDFGDLKMMYFTEDEGYKFTMTSKVYGTKFYDNTTVPDGDTVIIRLTTNYDGGSNNSGSNNSGSNNSGSNSGSNNSGSNNGGYGSSNGDTYYGSNGGTEVNKFPYDVILNVYLNNQVGTINKKITLNTGIALDGKVTLGEVKSLLKNYYTAKDSDGLIVDGLYFATGNWVGHFAYDMAKYDTLENLDEERKAHEVNIIVMLTNANAKSTTVASSDNPKTGDAIYACMTIMGVSATALAVLYFFNKKRAF